MGRFNHGIVAPAVRRRLIRWGETVSDFLFSSRRLPADACAPMLDPATGPSGTARGSREFSGDWGTLAVGPNHYPGFDPIETDRHVLAVVGGPWFLDGAGPDPEAPADRAATSALLRGVVEGTSRPEEVLSGPFAVILVDKLAGEVRITGDLLSFIPLFHARHEDDAEQLLVGSHVDLVARLAGREDSFDEVSLVDALTQGFVTYPHTCYAGVAQAAPGRELTISGPAATMRERAHWEPRASRDFRDVREAARACREGLVSAVAQATRHGDRAGLSLSGGADSRAVLGAIPPNVEAIGYTFTDRPNREAELARRVARAHGARWVHANRPPDYYPRQIVSASRLIGFQYQSNQIHAYGFVREWGLDELPAVLGGMFSDTFLKGLYIRTRPRSLRGVHWGRTEILGPERQGPPDRSGLALFREELVREAQARASAHWARLDEMRPGEAGEWFRLWPMSHNPDTHNFQGARRLYRAYEPFIDSRVVKAAAGVPQGWKLDRTLFREMARPLLRRTAGIAHSEGHYPYLGFWANIPASAATIAYRKLLRRFRKIRGVDEGSWPDMHATVRTDTMRRQIERAMPGFDRLSGLFRPGTSYEALFDRQLIHWQQILLVQALAAAMQAGRDGVAGAASQEDGRPRRSTRIEAGYEQAGTPARLVTTTDY